MLIIFGLFIYNLKQPSEAKKKDNKEKTKKKNKSKKEEDSLGISRSTVVHENLEERLQGLLLESQSAELKLAQSHVETPPLKRPRSNSNKSYGSVEIDNDNHSPKTKRHKALLRKQ